ncbi:MAG: cytochrome-c peroxidase [Pseudomonadota bacterium]
MRTWRFAAMLTVSAALGGASWAEPLPLPEPVSPDMYPEHSPVEVRLGQLLFYDPILSGNRNIACATCHHPRFATSDGLSLGLGEGAEGLGPDRVATTHNPPEQRIPRNSPALFNLGAHEFTVMFLDGRIETDPTRPSGLRTPLGEEMVVGFDSILSAQTMFPVLSPDEMAGHYQENDIAKAVRQGRLTGEGGAWSLISARVADLPDYARLFDAAYPEIAAGREIAFTDISNAIAAFIDVEWRSFESPFDAYLRGEVTLPSDAMAGMALFYGRAACSTCHAGAFQTDHSFHAMGQPQLGPGKAERFESHQRDIGRMRVTGRSEDAYAFRTPSLRNVARTGPWGHAGAYSDLGAFLRHHTDPRAGLVTYEPQATLPDLAGIKPDYAIVTEADEVAQIAQAVTRAPVTLSAEDIAALLAFLDTLTDPAAIAGRLGIPRTVPSGLPVDR